MDTSGQAAEQVVRYSLEGMEYTLKLAGKGTERLALTNPHGRQRNRPPGRRPMARSSSIWTGC